MNHTVCRTIDERYCVKQVKSMQFLTKYTCSNLCQINIENIFREFDKDRSKINMQRLFAILHSSGVQIRHFTTTHSKWYTVMGQFYFRKKYEMVKESY